jgi:aspartate--ammonia ligase
MGRPGKTTQRRRLILPRGYHSPLTLLETELGIKAIKDRFQLNLSKALNLSRVSAPIAVLKKSGINDYLCGTEAPAGFRIKDLGEQAEIVQSLAKWKRQALADYEFKSGAGLYTDMNAIRPDELLDNLHSIYVDQWDWELVMKRNERDINFLKKTVKKIYRAIRNTENATCKLFPKLPKPYLPKNIKFIHAQELCDLYPKLSPSAREDAICREFGAVFIIGIGANLTDGRKHDDRAADYDDWSTQTAENRYGLNGDILIWYPVLDRAFEISSMGIRVDRKTLLEQLKIKGELKKRALPYHKKLLAGRLPQTIGGGIGQSRLCMLFLRKAHIGEVQAGIWPDSMIRSMKRHNAHLL